jgi:hypothetical protein
MGRKLPTEQDPNPKVYAIETLFAANEVVAKSKYWYHLRRQLENQSRSRTNSCPSTKFTKEDPITLKPSASSSDINPEPESTTCTKSTEIFHSMELSANFIWKWLVITEPQEIPSQSSEQQYLNNKDDIRRPRSHLVQSK